MDVIGVTDFRGVIDVTDFRGVTDIIDFTGVTGTTDFTDAIGATSLFLSLSFATASKDAYRRCSSSLAA